MQDGLKAGDMDAFLAAQFAAADSDRDGAIGPDDFATYYGGLGVCRARQQLRASMGVEAESALLAAPHAGSISAVEPV